MKIYVDADACPVGQDEEPFINPILINEDAADLFSFDDIRAVGEYLGNVWFGIQYELINCPEEIRVVEQRDRSLQEAIIKRGMGLFM